MRFFIFFCQLYNKSFNFVNDSWIISEKEIKTGFDALKSAECKSIEQISIDSKDFRAEFFIMKPNIYPFLSMVQVFTYPHGIYSKNQ